MFFHTLDVMYVMYVLMYVIRCLFFHTLDVTDLTFWLLPLCKTNEGFRGPSVFSRGVFRTLSDVQEEAWLKNSNLWCLIGFWTYFWMSSTMVALHGIIKKFMKYEIGINSLKYFTKGFRLQHTSSLKNFLAEFFVTDVLWIYCFLLH